MSMDIQHIDVVIQIDAQRWLEYYRQPNVRVQVRALDGRLIELQATKLQPFVSHSGIVGTFRLTLDKKHKLLNIQRIASENS